MRVFGFYGPHHPMNRDTNRARPTTADHDIFMPGDKFLALVSGLKMAKVCVVHFKGLVP